MFNVSSFHFSSIELDSRLSLSYSLFIWFLIIRTLSQVLCKFLLCSFCFSSFKGKTRFCLSIIICFIGRSSLAQHPRFFINLIVCSVASRQWDTIQGSNSVDSIFIWVLIIKIPSKVLIQLIIYSFGFLIIGIPSLVVSKFLICFSSLEHHPRLY